MGVFVALLPLCSRGLLGGADLKLLASLSLGLPPQTSLHLIAAVAIAGGGLAVVYVGLSKTIAIWATHRPPTCRQNSLLRRIASVECC